MNIKKVIGLFAAAIVGATVLACGGSPSEDSSVDTAVSEPSSTAKPSPLPTKGKQYVQPTAKDFTLKIRVTSKDNFRTAGCLLSYRVYDLTYGRDLATLDPDKQYELTYEVAGLESGTEGGSIQFQGGKYSAPNEQVGAQITQAQCRKKNPLTVAVTEVNEL